MNFLCRGHRKQLALLPNNNKSHLWFEWMDKATLHMEFEQWPQAASYFGCAFELSCLALANNNDDADNHNHQLMISTLYLIHCLEQMQEHSKAALCAELSQQILLKHWSKQPEVHSFAHCLRTLMNTAQHATIVQHFSPFNDLDQPCSDYSFSSKPFAAPKHERKTHNSESSFFTADKQATPQLAH